MVDSQPPCTLCQIIRTALLAAVLGGAAGFGAHYLGLGSRWSMLATFSGAMIPVMYRARRRTRR